MKDELILVKPSIEYKKQAINFIEEMELDQVNTNERKYYPGFSDLQEYKNNYEKWLEKIDSYTKKETLPEDKVIGSVFFSVRKSDNKVVGIINIRHEFNDYLYNYGGHIGYSILPSERRKGYGYEQLKLGLEFCKSIGIKRVLITCLDNNIGSSKTIEKAGGVLENVVREEQEGKMLKRYWISLKKKYAKEVKTKFTDVKKIRQKLKSIDEKDFKGDIYLNYFIEVAKPFELYKGVYLYDNEYKWLEFYDYKSRVRLTAIYDENNKIVEWYFDIARSIGKENGIPYEDDMYLDVVFRPNGNIVLLDEDELKEAFDKKEMTKQEYDEAYEVAKNLMKKLKNNKDKVEEFTDKYLKEMLNLN